MKPNTKILCGFIALGVSFASLNQIMNTILISGSDFVADARRHEPLIETQAELKKVVEEYRKDLNLDGVKIDARLESLAKRNGGGYCKFLEKNHYEIILNIKDSSRATVEHELFHAHEMQIGKLKPRSDGKVFIPSYWAAEWRAQNYCLRNYKDGKKIK